MELKPCPFCGGIPSLKYVEHPKKLWVVCCDACGVYLQQHIFNHKRGRIDLYNYNVEWHKDMAIRKWNRRAE